MEAGQLITRHLSDLSTIDQSLLTDEPFNSYLGTMRVQLASYEKGLVQIQKNEVTEKIRLADKARDKAVFAFNAALKLYSLSDDADEVEASRVLGIVFRSFKNLTTQNYESESLAIDKLVTELEKTEMSAKVVKLKMQRYVLRLKTTNDNFKILFGSRIVGTAIIEAYDMKILRSELYKTYSEFTKYVLAMANALKTPLFTTSLNLINVSRKYYADLLAHRIVPKTEKTEQTENQES